MRSQKAPHGPFKLRKASEDARGGDGGGTCACLTRAGGRPDCFVSEASRSAAQGRAPAGTVVVHTGEHRLAIQMIVREPSDPLRRRAELGVVV